MPAPSLSIALFFCLRPPLFVIDVRNLSLASTINNGANAAFTLPPRLDAAVENLDAQTLALVRSTLDTQAVALSLLTQRFEQVLNIMEVDPPTDLSSANSSAPEHIEIDGQAMDIVYPLQPQPDDTIVLPGRYEDNVFYAVYQEINHLTRPELQDLCKQYSLATQGNKVVMKERLTGFSENKIRWQCLLPNARRSHRGVRQGGITKVKSKPATLAQSKTKKAKASTQRRGVMMGFGPDTPLSAQVFAAERSKDTRTVEQKNDLLRWAKDFCNSHPYVPREELARRRKAREEEKQRQKMSDSTLVSESIRSMAEEIARLNNRIEALVLERSGQPQISHNMSFIPSQPPPQLSHNESLAASQPPPQLSHNGSLAASHPPLQLPHNPLLFPSHPPPQPPHNPSVVPSQLPTVSSVQPAPVAYPSAASTLASTASDKLVIGHGVVLEYNYHQDVNEPPVISFAGRISRLSRVWDDEHTSWDPVDCGNNLLEIKGTAIALRYWQEVFRGRKGSTIWSRLKKTWTEWRYVAEHYHERGPEPFWQEFSVGNDRLPWSTIANRLRVIRDKQEQQLVERAKAEYGDQFGKIFVNNRGVKLTAQSAIARRYLEELSKRS
ncbi:hypothetical protein EV360DRAFT_87939 [Lentinula raphanica]|nr:hypothetical protein EV360DRAFT_87939 [Lentinula raphanica]